MCMECENGRLVAGSPWMRVRRSAEMLDRASRLPDSPIPADWRVRIEDDRLDMFDGRWCVIGQITGGAYANTTDWLQDNVGDELPEFIYRHGFIGASSDEDREIADAWREYLAHCRVAGIMLPA